MPGQYRGYKPGVKRATILGQTLQSFEEGRREGGGVGQTRIDRQMCLACPCHSLWPTGRWPNSELNLPSHHKMQESEIRGIDAFLGIIITLLKLSSFVARIAIQLKCHCTPWLLVSFALKSYFLEHLSTKLRENSSTFTLHYVLWSGMSRAR